MRRLRSFSFPLSCIRHGCNKKKKNSCVRRPANGCYIMLVKKKMKMEREWKKKKKLTWVQEMSSVSWAFLSGRGDIGVGGYVAHQSDVVLVVTWWRVEVWSVLVLDIPVVYINVSTVKRKKKTHTNASRAPLSLLGATLVVTWWCGDRCMF